MRVNYSYLHQQFAEVDEYFDDLRELVKGCEFTFGSYLDSFEEKFARYLGVKHAVGTNSGTDSLILALKAAGVNPGDEVITVPNTFVGTVGAIVAVGAKPVFVDTDRRYQIDVNQIEAAITPSTGAIIPVHWAGCPADIEPVVEIGNRLGVPIVEDACSAFGAKVNGQFVGAFGKANAFSMHPLKTLNVWGDGGMVVTDDDDVAAFLRVYRNNGLADRDHAAFWGVNTRLQPVQAVVANRELDRVESIIEARVRNARQIDAGLAELADFIRVPHRPAGYREVYQVYMVGVDRRDDLMTYLNDREVECRVHYPIPLHLQDAAAGLGYSRGDFPMCEQQATEILTFPAHQYITDEQIDYMLSSVRGFYGA
jgi:dTDP-4-amino-4,6-dideoxygalactose transaminase